MIDEIDPPPDGWTVNALREECAAKDAEVERLQKNIGMLREALLIARDKIKDGYDPGDGSKGWLNALELIEAALRETE